MTFKSHTLKLKFSCLPLLCQCAKLRSFSTQPTLNEHPLCAKSSVILGKRRGDETEPLPIKNLVFLRKTKDEEIAVYEMTSKPQRQTRGAQIGQEGAAVLIWENFQKVKKEISCRCTWGSLGEREVPGSFSSKNSWQGQGKKKRSIFSGTPGTLLGQNMRWEVRLWDSRAGRGARKLPLATCKTHMPHNLRNTNWKCTLQTLRAVNAPVGVNFWSVFTRRSISVIKTPRPVTVKIVNNI